MSIVLDIILLLIIVSIVIISYRRGFIGSVLSLASVIVSSVAAWMFHIPLAEYISSTFLVDPFSAVAKEKIQSFSSDGNLERLFTELPTDFSDFLTNNGLDPTHISEEFVNCGLSAVNYLDSLAQRIGSALAYLVSCAIALILIFALCSIICSVISIFLKAVFKLPLLNSANKLLGLILGLCVALISAWVFSCGTVSFIRGMSVLYPEMIAADTAEKTILVSAFYSLNPFSLLF